MPDKPLKSLTFIKCPKKTQNICTDINTHNVVRSLIVGVSVQAINNGAVECEGTGMTQTAHGAELVSLCVSLWKDPYNPANSQQNTHTHTHRGPDH